MTIAPDAAAETCMTSAYNCPRLKICWRYQKPAAKDQQYADFAGGADCGDFVAILGEVA